MIRKLSTMLLLTMLYPLMESDYRIESHREHGLGRPDIVLYPPAGKPPIIIELKKLKPNRRYADHPDERVSDLQIESEKAVQQIHEKEYSSALPPDTRNAIYCGIACLTKYVMVKMELVDIPPRPPRSDIGEN